MDELQMDERRVPVIVGVGEVVGNRDRDPDLAREPLELILDAVTTAAGDAIGAAGGAGTRDLLAAVDAVYAVRTTSWNYDEASSLVAERVGARPAHRVDTKVGGHWPARLLEQAAARIAAGDGQVALLFGGEAQASHGALAKAGRDPVTDAGWTAAPGGPPAFDTEDLGSPGMQAAGIVLPTRVYPMFQNALQADLGLTPAAGAQRSAELYARLTEVAAGNPIAWNPRIRAADEIATVAAGNRMVSEPYPLAVNAMPHVDQAAAVLITSVAAARAHGIPEDRWVHVWGGAGASDTTDVLERGTYAASDALAEALDRALERTGVSTSQLDLVDVYSCFPVVPELVARHLGMPEGATPSATGGHAAFGGPLSSYSVHAIASVTRRLRGGADIAAVHANGGYLTHQHVTVLGRGPHPHGYVGDPEPVTVGAGAAPRVRDAADLLAAAAGGSVPLVIETWTVEHGRDARPAQAFVIGRTPSGERVAAATAPGDTAAAEALSFEALPVGSTSHIGRAVTVTSLDAGPVIVP
jgi:acetyl-CoA C-acetyltransferase